MYLKYKSKFLYEKWNRKIWIFQKVKIVFVFLNGLSNFKI